MEKEMLLAELTKNCKKYGKELFEMMKVLDLTILGDKVQEQQFKDIHNRVLSENEFYAEKDVSRRIPVRKGDRITDEKYDFLMSKDDFDKYQELCLPYYVNGNLTDEKGYFITNWSMKVIEEKNNVFDFICKKVLPKELGDVFYEQRWRLTVQDKVIDLTRKAIAA